MTDFYLAGTRTGLSAGEAKDIAFSRLPAVARPLDRSDWYVAFLTSGPLQPGQRPFVLTDDERKALYNNRPEGMMRNQFEFAGVKTRRNTKFTDWYDLLNAECEKRGVSTPTFGPAHEAYDMGESPETAASNMETSAA